MEDNPSDVVIENPFLVVDEQAIDAELWLGPATEHEAILQRALRRLHAAVVSESWPT